ncbi:hypothetical protein CNR22_02725 [Sphingobacteriaceae bacterium]|nr:hypothetical protein CNR22_02725 [Sphingobacteriaceae bacterium]
MIQRKQTLFLLALALTSISLLFIPVGTASINGVPMNFSLLLKNAGEFHSTIWHFLAVSLNALAIVLSVVTIFIYRKRILQIKLCYVLMLIELAIALIISFCPQSQLFQTESSGFGIIICVIGVMCAYLAARYIKKDIELLKSADRIR